MSSNSKTSPVLSDFKRSLVKALAEIAANEPQLIVRDVKQLSNIISAMRGTFKHTLVGLVIVDVQDLDEKGTKWAPTWSPFCDTFNEILTAAKDSASKVHAYCTAFEEYFLTISVDNSISVDNKLPALKAYIDKSKGFEQGSNEISDKLHSLAKQLASFKESFGLWVSSLGKIAPPEVKVLDNMIAQFNHKFLGLKDELGQYTLVSSAVTLAYALVPDFAAYTFSTALISLGKPNPDLERINGELASTWADLQNTKSKKVYLIKSLDYVLYIQNDLDAEIIGQFDFVHVSLLQFEAIWRDVVGDCQGVIDWMEQGCDKESYPPVLSVFSEIGYTVYKRLKSALSVYVELSN